MGSDGRNDNKVYVLDLGRGTADASATPSVGELKTIGDQINSGKTTNGGTYSGQFTGDNDTPSSFSATDLGITHSEFQASASILKHEAGTDNATETLWLAHTSQNAAKESGMNIYGKLMTGYSAAPSSVKNTLLSTSDNSTKSNNARAGIIDALSGGIDPTGGATLWDGTDFLAWGTSHDKFYQYKNITIRSDIFLNYSDAQLRKYDAGRVGYKINGQMKYYEIPAAVFQDENNWSFKKNGIFFDYETGANVRYGIEATGNQGQSIFWRKK